jgi:hypothetical protein
VKIPRDLSGREIVKVLCKSWDYRQIHQEGSQIILQTDIPLHQRISIPDSRSSSHGHPQQYSAAGSDAQGRGQAKRISLILSHPFLTFRRKSTATGIK